MSRAPGSSGARIACIALAGTIGAMGMLGHRRGGATDLFATGGWQAMTALPPIPAAIAGVMIHALWMLVWGFVLVALVRHHRGTGATLAAIGVAVLAFVTAIALPDALLGPVATLATGERVLIHVVLALSLLIGMRLAPSGDAWVD